MFLFPTGSLRQRWNIWAEAPPGGPRIRTAYDRAMSSNLVAHWRMHNLRLSGAPLETAQEAVRWLCAVQSQDYGPAKWSVAARTRGVGDAAMDQAKEIEAALKSAGIVANRFRLAYVLMNAELKSIICSGPLNGKQPPRTGTENSWGHHRTGGRHGHIGRQEESSASDPRHRPRLLIVPGPRVTQEEA